MLFKLESKPKHSNCSRCQSTELMGRLLDKSTTGIIGKIGVIGGIITVILWSITITFLSIYNDSRYCVNCNKKYDRADEVRLREQKMDEAQWAV